MKQIGPYTVHRGKTVITIELPEDQVEHMMQQLEHLLEPTIGLQSAWKLVQEHRCITTRIVADKLDLNISNASNKMRALWQQGYVKRKEQVSPTGGMEHQYYIED